MFLSSYPYDLLICQVKGPGTNKNGQQKIYHNTLGGVVKMSKKGKSGFYWKFWLSEKEHVASIVRHFHLIVVDHPSLEEDNVDSNSSDDSDDGSNNPFTHNWDSNVK